MFESSSREVEPELRWLPEPHARWRARRIAAAVLLGAGGVLLWVSFPDRLELATGIALTIGFAWGLARLERSHRILLRLSLGGWGDVPSSVSALEALAEEARFDARVHACLIAAVAELELRRGDGDRGRRLFAELSRRGWSPVELVGGSLSGSGPVMSAAATMVALEALSSDLATLEPRLVDLERTGRRWATLLARSILMLKAGRAQDAATMLDGRLPAASPALPAEQLAELRTLHAFARAASGRDPYRASGRARAPRATLGDARDRSQRWLTESWPALRAFVE